MLKLKSQFESVIKGKAQKPVKFNSLKEQNDKTINPFRDRQTMRKMDYLSYHRRDMNI